MTSTTFFQKKIDKQSLSCNNCTIEFMITGGSSHVIYLKNCCLECFGKFQGYGELTNLF